MTDTATKPKAGKGNRTKGPRPRYNTVLSFEPVAPDDVPAIQRANSPTATLLNGFVNAVDSEGSPVQAARVPVPEGRKPESIAGNLAGFATRHKLPIEVTSRAGHVWLRRLSAEEATEKYAPKPNGETSTEVSVESEA